MSDNQTVQWSSCNRLSCCGTPNAPVVLCITPSSIIAQRECPEAYAGTDYAYQTVEAQLLSVVVIQNANCQKVYRYTFLYDADQLTGTNTLSESNIIGAVCQGCLTTYVQDLVGNEVQIVVSEDESEITLITQHGCEYTFEVGAGAALVVTDTQACTETVEFESGGDVLATIELTDRSYYTQVAHGFTLPPWGLLPLTWDSTLGKFILAQADSYANVAVLLASGFPDANTIKFFDGSFASITHNLTVGQWYALDPLVPGGVVLASTLDPDYDIYQILFFTLSSNCLLVRLDACACPSGGPTPPPPPPDPSVIIEEDFEDGEDCGIDTGFWNGGAIDTSLYAPNTAVEPYGTIDPPEGYTCYGIYNCPTGTDEKTPFTLSKSMNFSEIYLEWQVNPQSNPGPLPYPWGGQKHARMGDLAGFGNQVPFVFIESPAGYNNGNFQSFVFDDQGNQLVTDNQENIFVDDTWQKLGIYVKLNTPGTADGIMQKFYNDNLVFSSTSVLYRHTANTNQFSFFWIQGNYSWGNGAGAPDYPSPPHFSVPSPGGQYHFGAVRVLTTKPNNLP